MMLSINVFLDIFVDIVTFGERIFNKQSAILLVIIVLADLFFTRMGKILYMVS